LCTPSAPFRRLGGDLFLSEVDLHYTGFLPELLLVLSLRLTSASWRSTNSSRRRLNSFEGKTVNQEITSLRYKKRSLHRRNYCRVRT
jgi:hypothetical protein